MSAATAYSSCDFDILHISNILLFTFWFIILFLISYDTIVNESLFFSLPQQLKKSSLLYLAANVEAQHCLSQKLIIIESKVAALCSNFQFFIISSHVGDVVFLLLVLQMVLLPDVGIVRTQCTHAGSAYCVRREGGIQWHKCERVLKPCQTCNVAFSVKTWLPRCNDNCFI